MEGGKILSYRYEYGERCQGLLGLVLSRVLILKNACLYSIMVPSYSFIPWLKPASTAPGGLQHEPPEVEVGDERPSKHARVSRFRFIHARCVIDGTEHTHEDASSPTFFSNDDLEDMEGYDGELIAEREFEDDDFDMNGSQMKHLRS